MKATITVVWGYEPHSITLTADEWAQIKNEKPLSIDGDGYYYEGEFFPDYWHFGGGLAGDLCVDYGDDGGCGFDGSLSDARIKEHE